MEWVGGDLDNEMHNDGSMPRQGKAHDTSGRREGVNLAERHAAVLRRLPERSPFEGLEGSSCAVVGNSGVLLGQGHGQEIDGHDVVFRVNSPPLERHTADVGRRTTVSTLNPSQYTWPWQGHEAWLGRMKELGWPALVLNDVLVRGTLIEALEGRDSFISTHDTYAEGNTTVYVWHDGFLDAVEGWWRAQGVRGQRASTGAIMVAAALSACAPGRVHLYGFFPFGCDKDRRAIPYHFYEAHNHETSLHSMSDEFEVMRRLETNGALKLVDGHLAPPLTPPSEGASHSRGKKHMYYCHKGAHPNLL